MDELVEAALAALDDLLVEHGVVQKDEGGQVPPAHVPRKACTSRAPWVPARPC